MKNDLEKKVMRKVTLRIIPFIMLLYFIAFLDRVNIGFAALTMNQDLGFSPTVFGLGAGIFFLGYFLFEVPSNLILHKVGARIWIARVMITLGIRLWLHGFCAGHDELLHSAFSARRGGSRFLPGDHSLSQLLVSCRRGVRRSLPSLWPQLPLSTALGSPVSAALLEMHGFLGYAGWQWMFVLEALPALVLGVVVLFFLTDRPAKAKWLTDQERASAGKRHARRGAGTGGKTEPFQRMARASGYTRPGAGAGLFRYLSRAVYAWHLVPANHSQFRCFLAGDWFPERLSGGDRRHRHDPLGASFRSNQRAQLARHWRLPAGGCRADIRR